MSILSLELPCSPGGFDFLRSLKNFLSAFHAKIYGYASEKKRLSRKNSVANNAKYILDTYGNSILRLAYSYVHNMSDAEDLLQDTLITYLDSAPNFENEAHEKAWLLKVTANLSKNKIAYNRIRDTGELNEELIDEQREDLSFVWDAVKNLPDKYREAVHLFYYEGYSTAEISKILGRKESTIRSDLRRARAELRMILREVYDFE